NTAPGDPGSSALPLPGTGEVIAMAVRPQSHPSAASSPPGSRAGPVARTDPIGSEQPTVPSVIVLEDPLATDPALVGGKAAALARARSSGLRTMPAAILTTAVSRRFDSGG